MRTSGFLSNDYSTQRTSYDTNSPLSSFSTEAFMNTKRYSSPTKVEEKPLSQSYVATSTLSNSYTATSPLSNSYTTVNPLRNSYTAPTSNPYTGSILEARTEQETTTETVTSLHIPMPTMSWEQFVLINVEMDRLGGLVVRFGTERDSLKAQLDDQVRANAEAERIHQLKAQEFETQILKSADENRNLKFKLDEQFRINAENERVFRSRVNEFENKIAQMTQDNNTLDSQLRDRVREVSTLKTKIDEQNRASAEYERQTKAKIANLESNISKLTEDNKNLDTQLRDRIREVSTLKTTIAEQNRASAEYERQTNAKIANLEANISKLTEDNSNLSAQLKDKVREVLLLGANLSKMTEENKSLTFQLKEKTTESASWRAKFDDQVKANTENLRINKMKVSELENRIMNITKDNQILATQVAQKVEELTIWKLKYNEMELQAKEFAAMNYTLNAENDKLSHALAQRTEDLERAQKENRQIQLFIEEKYAEIERLNQLILDAHEKIEYLENEKLSLTEELNEKLAHIKDLQGALHEQNPGADHSKCCGQYKKIRAENNQKTKEANETRVRNARIDATEKKLLQLLEQKKKLTNENDRLEGMILDKQNQAKSLRDSMFSATSPKNNPKSPMSKSPRKALGSRSPTKMRESQGFGEMVAEIEKDDEINEEPVRSPSKRTTQKKVSLSPARSAGDLSLTPKKFSQVRNRLTAAEGGRPKTTVPVANDLESQLQAVTEERDRLRTLLEEKIQEIKGLEMKLTEAKFYEEQYETMVKEKESMSSVLTEKIENVEDMAMRLKEVEGELSQVVLQAKATLLASENEKLNTDLNKKISNIEEWKSKLGVLETLQIFDKKTDKKQKQKEDNSTETKLKKSLVLSRTGVMGQSQESVNSDAVTQGSPGVEEAPISFRLKLQN